jgi:hypothetical protein
MKSYTELRNLFGSLTNNTATTNFLLGDELINDAIRSICDMYAWNFLEKTKTASTVASQQAYNLPHDCKKLLSVTLTISSNVYLPKECQSRKLWEDLNQTTTQTSDTPEWYFVFGDQLLLYPTPASASNTITYSYLRKTPNLSIADYTTGSVATTDGSTTVTGSGTAWTSAMAGRWLRITPTSTATASGDGLWYEIASVSDGSTLVLTKPYAGTDIAIATAYIIGEMPVLPESFHTMPVWSACEVYFSNKTEDLPRSQLYKRKYDEGIMSLKSMYGRKSTSVVINETSGTQTNPNLSVTL